MFDENLSVVAKLLDVSALRHRAIAHNIANINTSDCKRQEVVFEQLLDDENAKQSILSQTPEIVEREQGERIDGNTSSLEQEMGSLTRNHLEQQVYLRALTYKLRGIKGVIQGRF